MKTKAFLFFILPLTLLATGNIQASVGGFNDYLWFSLTPAMHMGQNHGGGGKTKGHGSHSGHESEHRPKPVRTYWLNSCSISASAQAYTMKPEGEYSSVPVKKEGHNVSVTIKTPYGEGPFHGGNSIYLVDQAVEQGTLVLRTAKWLSIHHSCGWGHDHKFNKKRMVPWSLDQVPLEIVVDNLWDMNFHSTVMSGDTISLTVFSYGKPVKGATVTVISDKGWQKRVTTDEEGRASFEMVTDYYPKSWSLFNRRKVGKLKFTAAHDVDMAGTTEAGEKYERTKMLSTFSWRYYPAVSGYSSLANGLLVAVLFMSISGLGVFIYRGKRTKTYRDISFDE